MIEDISLWGQFEELTSKIKKDLKATSASELYEIVLGRLETDYDNKGKNIGALSFSLPLEKQIIKNFMSYLWASRRGLFLETELAIVLEDISIEHHEWSPGSEKSDISDVFSVCDSRGLVVECWRTFDICQQVFDCQIVLNL